MNIIETILPGVMLLEPKVYTDDRGFFLESFRAYTYGFKSFLQDNHSFSLKGVLRGLHYQPGQAKLVRVTRGAIFDVAVDIRPGSHFGQWYGKELNETNHLQLYIPDGFAHGFCVLEDADVQYKCTEYYSPKGERGIAWDDPDIGIHWPIDNVFLSERDKNNPRLYEIINHRG